MYVLKAIQTPGLRNAKRLFSRPSALIMIVPVFGPSTVNSQADRAHGFYPLAFLKFLCYSVDDAKASGAIHTVGG